MFTLNCKGKLLVIEEPLIMGILNLTDDSFYAKSRVSSLDNLTDRASQMVEDGAAILDIGAQSSRPGSVPINEVSEIKKIGMAVDELHKKFPDIIISVDTYRSNVAKEGISAGASIINDISSGNLDDQMIPTVGKLGVPYICMHMKGTPHDMNEHSSYNDLLSEISKYFIEKIAVCNDAGIEDIIIDPGFGFAKNITQNFNLLKNLSIFKIFEKPILAGLSRKSTIYKTLQTDATQALNGTTVLNTLALQNGANILRVHDVKEASETIRLFRAYSRA